MKLQDLRAEGKKAGISNYWSKGEQTLLAELGIDEPELIEDSVEEIEEPTEELEEATEELEEATSPDYEYEETTSGQSSSDMQSEGWEVYEMPKIKGILTHKLKRKING